MGVLSLSLSAHPTPRDVRVVWSGAADRPRVALTFDDGPSLDHTPRVLDLLRDAGCRATFFVVGQRVESSGAGGREILRRMIAEGHEIGNHSFVHGHAPRLSALSLKKDLERCQEAVVNACGARPRLYRPPGGGIDFSVVRSLASTEIEAVVMWSVDPSDWMSPGRETIWRRVAAGLQPGAVILLHDTGRDTLRALPLIIDMIQARGYEIVTVSELIGS